jgi:hypothetical protein
MMKRDSFLNSQNRHRPPHRVQPRHRGPRPPGVNVINVFFPLSLVMRPNKLEGLPLETLSSQVLEFEGRPEPTQLETLSDASFLGKLLVLPANIRLDWKVVARYKHSSLFGLIISNEGKKIYNIDTRCQSY